MVIDVAVLSAVGILPDGRRTVLGVSVALSEAEVHWRDFLNGLVARGMRGVRYIVSDDHAGLGAARKAVLSGVGLAAMPVPLGPERGAPLPVGQGPP